VATDSSTLLPTATPVANQLGSYLAYPEWKKTNSTPGTPTEEDLPNYLDYYRVESLKRGELTQQKESEIQDYYVDWYTGGKPVSDEEYGAIANMSTGYTLGTNQEAALVSRVFPLVDWADLDNSKKNEYLNRSKKALLQAGELPFASLVEGDVGVVHIGNYGQQGTSTDNFTVSGNQALEAYHAGAIDPRDLWQVAEGLGESGIPNKTKFQADLDKRDLETLKTLLLNPESETAIKISEAIQNTIDLESYRKEGSWWSQLWADRPEDINQIIADKLPPEIAQIQPTLMKEIGKREGWGDIQMSGISPDNVHRYTNERLFKLVKELAISHANNQGVFKYDSDNHENNIRITPMGLPIAHPELMKRGDFYEIISQDKRLSDRQRQALKVSRNNFIINSQLPAMDKMWSQEHLDSVVGDRWASYKTENPNGLRENPEAFYDNFINDKNNYDQSKNWWGGVGASIPNAVVGIGASIGAMLGDETSAKYLADHQKKEASRKQTASLFGENLGFGYDLATTTSQVVADIGATFLVAGGLSKLSKLSKIGSIETKNIVASKTSQILNSTSGSKARRMTRARVRQLIDESGINSAKTKTALNAYNDLVAKEFGIKSALFLTAANRSAGATYATVYNSLPDDMPHEEKHDKSLGPGLLGGTITGAITTGFSALNMGGAEDIVSKGITYHQLKNSLKSIGGAEWVNDSTTKALLKKPIKNKLLDLVGSKNQGVFAQTIRGAVHEGLEEGLDEFVNSFVETSATNEFLPMADRINHSMYAMSLGGVLGGTITLAGNYTVGLNKIKSLAQSKSFDPQKQAEDIAFENAAIALQESGLNISAEQLRSLRDTQVESDKVEAEEAGESEVQEVMVEDTEVQESQVQESKPLTTSLFSPDFSGEIDIPLIEKYIQSWKPSQEKQQEIVLDIKKLDGGRPMRVGVLRENTQDPIIVWQIDAGALANELNNIDDLASRQGVLDKYIAHELVHVSEFNFIKERWKKYNRENPNARTPFSDFYLAHQEKIYDSLLAQGNVPLRESVADHLGIDDVGNVNLPGEEAEGDVQMSKDEIVSEFTRQFLEISRNNPEGIKSSDRFKYQAILADRFKGVSPEFLAFVQDVVEHTRGYVDPESSVVPSENQGAHENATKELREHLDGVEDFYVDILRSTLEGKVLDFNAAEPADIEAYIDADLQGEIAKDPKLDAEADAKYLELAEDEEANREELQRMVDEAAEAAGLTRVLKTIPKKHPFRDIEVGDWVSVDNEKGREYQEEYAGDNWEQENHVPKAYVRREDLTDWESGSDVDQTLQIEKPDAENPGPDPSIWSADPVIRDNNDNVIPLSQRFGQKDSIMDARMEADLQGEIAEESKFDVEWEGHKNSYNNTKFTGKDVDKQMLEQREEALLGMYKAHLLANGNLQLTEASVDALIEWYKQVEGDFAGKDAPDKVERIQTEGVTLFKNNDSGVKVPNEVYKKIRKAIVDADSLKASSFLKALTMSLSPKLGEEGDWIVTAVAPSESYKLLNHVAPDIGILENASMDAKGVASSMNSLMAAIEEGSELDFIYDYRTRFTHTPIVVNGNVATVNVYGLATLIHETKTVKSAKKLIEQQLHLKELETGLLEVVDSKVIEEIANEVGPQMLSLLSKESNDTLNTMFLVNEEGSKQTILDDNGNIRPDAARYVISNIIKKYSSEALSSSYNLRNTFSLLNAFPSLKALAIQSLDSTISEADANIAKPKIAQLKRAKLHLESGQFKDSHTQILPFDPEKDYHLDFIRTVVSTSVAPNEESEIDEEKSGLEQRLEVPIGEIGAYSAPANQKTGWIKKFWQLFLGNVDHRWKREQERRISFLERVKAESEQYINAIDDAVKQIGGWTPEITALMQKASGRTDGNEVSEEFENAANQVRITKKDNAKLDESNDAQALKEIFVEADAEFNEAIAEEKIRVSEENKRITKAAISELADLSPELADLVLTARAKITEASQLIAKKLEATGLKEFSSIKLRFDAQEGFYLTRTYKIFRDPKYSAAIKDKEVKSLDNINLEALRVRAGKEMVAEERRKMLAEAIAQQDKLAIEENNLEWLRKSELLKAEEVENRLNKQGSQVFKDLSDQEFADHFIQHIQDYGVDETDILKHKKKIPKAIRQAMGEVELPAYNIVQTLTNVNQFANSIAEGENLFNLGRVGDNQKDWWFFSEKEHKEIISTEGQENDPELYEMVKNFKPVFDADGNSVLPTGMRASFNELANPDKNYYMPPDMHAYFKSGAANRVYSLEEETAKGLNSFIRKSVGYSLGFKTMGSTTYYTRNVAGNLTFFPLSQGMLPVGIDKIMGEARRALGIGKESKGINEVVLELIELGVVEPEFTSAMLNDILDGRTNSESIKQQNFAIFNELQKANGLPEITEEEDTTLIKTLRKALTKKGLITPRDIVRKAQRLSLATDSWYKIGYYLHEKKELEKARQHDIDNNNTGPDSYASHTDEQIKAEAINIIKKTAQFYSQSSPLVDGWNQSSAGVLFAPYVRFRMEVPRIMINTYRQAFKEIKSDNPIIKKRGYARLTGMSSVGTLTAAGSLISEPILVALTAVMGHSAADDLDDDMRQALQLSVPSYLRDHTFLYTKKDGKYYSWDLTYLNPYAMWLDAVPTATRMIKQGHAPHEAMLYAGSKFFGLPFVEGQIATQSFFNTMQNRDAKGQPIWFDNDSPHTKFMKGIQSFAWEAYGPPTAKVLGGMAASAEAGQFDIGDAVRDLTVPLKPYEIDPTAAFSSLARQMNTERLAVRKKINKLVRDKPMSSSEIRAIAEDNVNISRVLAEKFRRYAPKFVEMEGGVSPELVAERGKSLFPKGRFSALGSGRFRPEELTPGMLQIMGQNVELRQMKKERYEEYFSHMRKYLAEQGGDYFLGD